MKTNGIIHVLGLSCRPDQDEKFNKWYNEQHVPDLLKFNGLRRATRYKLVSEGKRYSGVAEAKYPGYLAVYELGSKDSFEEYEASPEVAAAMVELRETWGNDPFERVWRVQFQYLQRWGDAEPRRVINVLGNTCRPDQEEKYNRWLNKRHVPELLKFKSLKTVTRYCALYPGRIYSGYPEVTYPRYLMTCEFDSEQIFHEYEVSPIIEKAHKDYRETWQEDPYERIWRVQFKLIQTWKQ
ncbi:hypothetical protein ACFLYV_02495 [Chloroflexota bacterium]